VRVLAKSPAPMVPAPTASDLPKNERRLIKLFVGLTHFSKFSSGLKSFAVSFLIVFIP